MSYTVKCNWGYKAYNTECKTIEEACEYTKRIYRLHADSGERGSGYIASELPRIDAEIDRIKEAGGGTVSNLPKGEGEGLEWTIKKKS